MTSLSPQAQAIVDAGRKAQAPSEATRASVLAALDRAVLEPGAGASASLAAASGNAGVSKVLMLAGLIAALGAGYFLLRAGDESSGKRRVAEVEVAPAIEPVIEPSAPAPVTQPAIPAPDAAPAAPIAIDTAARPKAKTKPSPRTRPSSKASAADLLLAEQKLIGAAQRATRDGDYAKAKSLLAEHRKTFARGVLAPERKATMAITSCLAGDLDDGQAAASAFLEAHAKSPLAGQVRKSCKLE